MALAPPGTVGSFVHDGWIVVAAPFTVLFLAYGVQYAFGLFLTALTEDFCGPAHAGSLVGLCFGLAGSGSGLGPILGGWLFDVTGTYVWAFGLGAALNGIAFLLVLLARPPDRRAT